MNAIFPCGRQAFPVAAIFALPLLAFNLSVLQADTTEVDLIASLSAKDAELRAILRSRGILCSLGTRHPFGSAPGYSADFALGTGLDKEASFAAGALRADGSLALVLDPLAAELPAFGKLPAHPDLVLRSNLRGAALGGRGFGLFAIEKKAGGGNEALSFFSDPVVLEEKPAHFVTAGIRTIIPLGLARIGAIVAVGRSGASGTIASWYDASLPGAWPRSLGAIFFSSQKSNPRLALVLGASSAMDKGSGLVLRLDGSESLDAEVLAFSLAVRSPRYLAMDGDEDLLARASVDLNGNLGNGLRLGLRSGLDAKAPLPDTLPLLTRKFRIRIDGESQNGLPLSMRCDGILESAIDDAALGNHLGFRWIGDGFVGGLTATARLEWSGADSGIFRDFPSALAYSSPGVLKFGMEANLNSEVFGEGKPFDLLCRSLLERQEPFGIPSADPYRASVGVAFACAPFNGFSIGLRAALEGRMARSFADSLADARIELSAESSLHIEI